MRVSVAICTYTHDRWTELLDAIDSVGAQSSPPDEIVVVVDHNDGLAEALADVRPNVRVLANAGPRGLSGARNTAIERATSDVIVFLDDDAIADPDWIKMLLEPFEDNDVVAVGGNARPLWESVRPAWFPDEFLWVLGCSHAGLPVDRCVVRNVIGCSMAFRLDAIRASGGFRSNLGRVGGRALGCEETEMCIRLVHDVPARRVLLEPRAGVAHRVPASRCTIRYFVRRCFGEGRSKAVVARMVGARDGLSSERTFAIGVLPKAFVRNVRLALRRRGMGPLRQSAAIVLGVSVTAFGYASGWLRRPGR